MGYDLEAQLPKDNPLAFVNDDEEEEEPLFTIFGFDFDIKFVALLAFVLLVLIGFGWYHFQMKAALTTQEALTKAAQAVAKKRASRKKNGSKKNLASQDPSASDEPEPKNLWGRVKSFVQENSLAAAAAGAV